MKGALGDAPEEAARAKVVQIFRFLKEFNQLRNPVRREISSQPWVLWFRDLPEHDAIQRGRRGVSGDGAEQGLEMDDFILKVRRPELTRAPEPPPSILPWLKSGWTMPDGAPEVEEEQSEALADGTVRQIRFDADPVRVAEFQRYVKTHGTWAEIEGPARAAMAVFERLYALHSHLDREAERVELMVGDGLLTWEVPECERIRHPILLQGLELTFNPDVPEFTLRDAAKPPELYTALLGEMPGVEASLLARCRRELEQGGCHPLGGQETDGFLRRLVLQLSPHGVFSPGWGQPVPADAPVLTRDPVLLVRSRSLGYSRMLESILEALEAGTEIPVAFSSIVGMEREWPAAVGELDRGESPNGEDADVLLTKPANPEQLQIAKRLERSGAVLVQGPPGTGKTHTIANLLGHFLAQGKSVLVTSHTSKALRIVRDQVVEPLRPLCVSVTDGGSSQLDEAIDAISERLSTADAAELEREAKVLERERLQMLRRLQELRTRLREARMDEYRPVVVAGEEFDPSQAARKVAEGRGRHDWIPGPVNMGDPLPLSVEEVHDLYRTNRSLSADDEEELSRLLPNPTDLMPPSTFSALVGEQDDLWQMDLEFRADLWRNPPADQDEDGLRDLLNRMHRALEPVRSEEPWRLAAISAGRDGAVQRRAWEDLIHQIQQVADLAAESDIALLRSGPKLPGDQPVVEVQQVLGEIIDHLKAGGSLGRIKLLLNKPWRRLVESAQVNGTRPSRLEDFEALHAAASLQIARERLAERWQRQMSPLGAPEAAALGAAPEIACQQFVPELKRCLSWFDQTWAPLEQELKAQGLLWDVLFSQTPVNLSPHGDLMRLHQAVAEYLPPVLQAQIRRLRLTGLQDELAALWRKLKLYAEAGDTGPSKLGIALEEAVSKTDSAQYEAAYHRLVTLWNKKADLRRRLELLQKLSPSALAWAAAIRAREGQHGWDEPPGDPGKAWLWRQLHDELERRGQVSFDDLQREISQLTRDLHRLTAALVEKKAWASQVRRTTLQQRQALNGWKELMRRVGRGTGRRAPHFLAEARRLMPQCQSAVPVWIMPLSRVAETFDPQQNRFDVVIIDEASQSDMLALGAVYLGKQVIVVGDHEQVSPLAVGLQYDSVKQLIDVHLPDVPIRQLFDGQSSIYDLAKIAFEPVFLQEHFRCVEPIIQFSNQLSYNGKIKPLRDGSQVRRRPATVAYRVDGATTLGKVNEQEAQAVASLLMAAAEQPEYEDATFGVISLVADEQAHRIDQLLHRYMPPVAYSRRRIRCGSAADFQGDERDVMFLSLVDAPDGDGPLPLRGEGANQMFKKRFNVAASRARDQMWVVHSLDPDLDLKEGDLRRRLIKHAEHPMAVAQAVEAAVDRTESEFEKQVITRLIRAGYQVVPQWQVGAYRIDMVVRDGDRRVAVECDGDRWHTAENLKQDMVRQLILERLGWRFIRIRGSQFFRNPDETMALVFGRLQEQGIRPVGEAPEVSEADKEGEELRQRIIRRAAEIRREWKERLQDLVG